jgi:hypothetical protein
MKLADWRWPQFSIAELLVAVALLATIWSVIAIKAPEELPATVAGSFVLLWGLVCWKTVRANQRGKKILRGHRGASGESIFRWGCCKPSGFGLRWGTGFRGCRR